MIRNGAVLEIKKQQGTSTLALNNSFLKNKLHSSDPKITKECKACEKWEEKDLVYIIGQVEKDTNRLISVWMIFGDCIAADKEYYERIAGEVKNALRSVNIKATRTTEPARFNSIDPLGITNFRVRGMWEMKHPSKVFAEYFSLVGEPNPFLTFILPESIFQTYPCQERAEVEKIEGVISKTLRIPNPNNPATCFDARFLLVPRKQK